MRGTLRLGSKISYMLPLCPFVSLIVWLLFRSGCLFPRWNRRVIVDTFVGNAHSAGSTDTDTQKAHGVVRSTSSTSSSSGW